jgi:MurNAc alpha-1-phosphate uridylyltransferase
LPLVRWRGDLQAQKFEKRTISLRAVHDRTVCQPAQMSSFMPAKAMVFAAGLGTRMRPLADRVPKPLIAVAGKPLIDHVLDRFALAGVDTAIVNVHYLAGQIEAHLAARKSPKILISDEREKLLDQGGGIAKVLPWLGPEPFFLANTDAFWIEGPTDNLQSLAAAWDPVRMDILLLVAAVAASVGVDSPGDFNMAPDGRLTRRQEREIAPFVYTGMGIVKPGLFTAETSEIFPLAPFFFEAAGKGRLFGHRLDGFWFHVGTPLAIEEAEGRLARGRIG